MSTGAPGSAEEFVRLLIGLKERGVRARLITDIKLPDVENARLAVQLLEVRHLADLKATFAVTDTEYLTLPVPDETIEASPLIYSNAPRLVEQHQFIFDKLWGSGEPAGQRIRALESGAELPEFEVIRDPARMKEVYLDAIKGAKSKVLLLLPSLRAYARDEKIGVIDAILGAAGSGAMVRLLAPLDLPTLEKLLSRAGRGRRGTFALRAIPPADTPESVTILAVDDRVALTLDGEDSKSGDFATAVGMATRVTNVGRLRTYIRFFERSWMESELREAERSARLREESSRRRAELMQDILTHDIRNFNQVTRLNAELLGDEVAGKEAKKRVAAILKSVDGSSRLIERTKRLGSILSSNPAKLRKMGIKPSVERSLYLVRKGNPEKSIHADFRVKGDVWADGLLDEVFTNLFSNSVRYTEGRDVKVSVRQEKSKLPRGGRQLDYWKVSVTDWGRGIPDSMKPTVFSRYLETAKGSGLGMSIVHALVTERYGGSIDVKDRVEGDCTKGTEVEIWLPKA